MKIALFLDIIGRGETFSEHGFQVSDRLSRFHYLHLTPECQYPIFIQSHDSLRVTAIFPS